MCELCVLANSMLLNSFNSSPVNLEWHTAAVVWSTASTTGIVSIVVLL